MQATYVLDVSVVDQLHEQQHVDEQLAFCVLHDLFSADQRAVQLVLRGLTSCERRRLAWQRQAVMQVRQVVL